MESKTKLESALDELLSGKTTDEIVGPNGLLKQLTKTLIERAMNAEMSHHLGYEKHASKGRGSGNSRNGTSRKNVQGDFGSVEIEVPRDRNGTYVPQIVPKHERRFAGFDDKILSMYARGMTTRDIQSHLEEMYGVEISPALISQVTDAVMEEVRQWQSRPLEPIYAIVYLDALMVKMRHEGRVENRAVFVAIGVTLEGSKEVLGLWTSATEGAKFWLQIVTEIRHRGVQDILIACIDGLKGFPEAIQSVYPKTEVQLCIVHMVRNSLNYVGWKERRAVAADLKEIYHAATAEQAEQRLSEFEQRWDSKYSAIGKLWRRNWAGIVPFFAYPEEIRRAVYTTNIVESLNMSLRKVIKTRGSFPNEEAALKLLYLGLRNVSRRWHASHDWRKALNHLVLLWGERIEAAQARPTR
ncbi:MAG: IS256 family transposase [Acidobacteriaceae bacterium]|nr:IS256 family transposase [Acidobacteriaceae bacterium]